MPRTTRADILAAFEALVARFGLDRVTMKDLAREAGVSVGSIYLHFENKEALIASIEDKWLEHVRIRNAMIVASDKPAEAQLHDLVVEHIDRLSQMIRSNQAAFELLMGALRLRYIRREMVDVRRQIFDAMIETATVVIARGAADGELDVDDADRTARHFVEAFADYFSPPEVIKRSHEQVAEGARGMFEFLMRGIRAR